MEHKQTLLRSQMNGQFRFVGSIQLTVPFTSSDIQRSICKRPFNQQPHISLHFGSRDLKQRSSPCLYPLTQVSLTDAIAHYNSTISETNEMTISTRRSPVKLVQLLSRNPSLSQHRPTPSRNRLVQRSRLLSPSSGPSQTAIQSRNLCPRR